MTRISYSLLAAIIASTVMLGTPAQAEERKPIVTTHMWQDQIEIKTYSFGPGLTFFAPHFPEIDGVAAAWEIMKIRGGMTHKNLRR